MKTYLGIDIGTSHIKLVEAGINGKTIEVVKAYMFPAVTRALASEATADIEELARTIKTGLKDSGISLRRANVSLNESQVFTRIIEMPLLSDKELVQALRWEAERYIPLPLDEVNMDFGVLTRFPDRKLMEILLVASPIRLIEKYSKILDMAGLAIDALENEALPVLRLFKDKNTNRVIVDVGDASTNIYLTRRDMLTLSHPTGIGGATFTKSLMAELNLPTAQAEEYKKTYGLNPAQMEGRIIKILSPLVDSLASEINQSVTYFKEKYPEEVMTSVLLTGGASLMPGFPMYIQEKIQLETGIANPWQNAVVGRGASQYQNTASFFTVATGLALREME